MIEILCPEGHPVLVPALESYSSANGFGVVTASAATDQLHDCPLCGRFLLHAAERRSERVRVAGHEQLEPVRDATKRVLAVLAYRGEIEVDQLATTTGVHHNRLETVLVDAKIFDVYVLDAEPVSVTLTDYGRRLARIAAQEQAAP